MGPEWINTTIGDQVTLQRGIDITKAEQSVGDVPVVSSGGIASYHNTSAASGPGVILGRKGVVGSVYFVASDYWPHDTTLWVRDFHGNHPRFVYYFFRWMAPTIAAMDVGSANPTLNRNHVHPIEIRWPASPAEQGAIASVLGALDDKIELNRRMNETLEAIARAIFKSWFVDFDPIPAKSEGRDAGPPTHLAAMSPGTLMVTEAGEIPTGWELRPLDKVANFLNGLPMQKFPPGSGSSLPVIKIAQLRMNSTEGADRASADIPSDYLVVDGDVLFSWSGSLECKIWAGGQGALNQHLFKVTTEYPKWFVYFWIHEHLSQFREIAAGKATTMGHIQRRHLSESMVVIPPPHVLEHAESILAPIMRRATDALVENRGLAELRDTLLPKLISGEIRVGDRHAFTGARA